MATQLGISTQPTGNNFASQALLAVQPVIQALNADASGDASYVGTVVPTLNVISGSPVLGGSEATGKACVAGVCTFTNLTVSGAGVWTITFSSAALTTVTTPQWKTFAASKLVVTTAAPAMTAGCGAFYPVVPMVVQAQTPGNVLDTAVGLPQNQSNPSFTDPRLSLTLNTVSGGPAVMSGPTSAGFIAGEAVFRGVRVSAPGTYTYTVTYAGSTPVTVTSGSFVVSATADTFVNPDNRLRGLGAALPRTVPSTTRPATGTVRYVGPSETYTTILAAVTAAAAAGGAQTIKLRAGQTISEEVVLPAYSGPGLTITSDGWSKTLGDRVAPADFTTQAIWQNVNANGQIFKAPSGANNYWFVGLHCRTNPTVVGNSALALLGFDDGDALAVNAAGIPNGLVVDQCYFHHDDPTSAHVCARAIRWRSKNSAIVNSYFIGFQRTSQPDAQSILCDNTPGNLLLDNNYIEGESEGFMIGGTSFIAADLVPQDVTITRNYWTKPAAYIVGPPAWQPKNLLELKAGHRVRIEGNIFDGFWDAGVTQWSAMNIKAVNQDSQHAQGFIGTSDVVAQHNFYRNIPDLFSVSGSPQGEVEPANNIVLYNALAANVNSTTWSDGSHGDGFLGHFSGYFDAVLDHLTVVSAPKATLLRTLLLGTWGSEAVRTTMSNILLVSDIGAPQIVSGSNASPNLNGIIATIDPAAVFDKNYIAGVDPAWLAYNANNAPASNTFATVDGAGLIADPGFTTWGIRATAATADPLAICTALVLASGAAKGTGTGGSDIGVKDMATLKTKITGVFAGVYSGGGSPAGPATWLRHRKRTAH